MRLYLVRHAESQGNAEMRLQGRTDYPLTARGLRQAEALATRLSRYDVTAVYASPIRRALDTAEAIAARLSLTVQPEPALQEYDFGETLSGMTWKEIRERRPGLIETLVSNDKEFPHYPGEEGREAFRERVCKGLWSIVERHAKEENVAVVSHAGPVAVFLLEVLGRGYRRPIPFTIDNASLTTVEIVEPGPSLGGVLPRAVLTGLNDTCHLAGE